MPIDIQSFEAAQETELRRHPTVPAHANAVLSFLAERDDQAFTLREIREALDLPRGSVGVTLVHLEDRGLVRHRGEYWAIASDANVRDREPLSA